MAETDKAASKWVAIGSFLVGSIISLSAGIDNTLMYGQIAPQSDLRTPLT